jgi:hypothetical protein
LKKFLMAVQGLAKLKGNVASFIQPYSTHEFRAGAGG